MDARIADSQEVVSREAAEATHDVTADALIEEVSIDGMCGVY